MGMIKATVVIEIAGRYFVDAAGAFLGEYFIPSIECEHGQMLPPADATEVFTQPPSSRAIWSFRAGAWDEPVDQKELDRLQEVRRKAALREAAVTKLAGLGFSAEEIDALTSR